MIIERVDALAQKLAQEDPCITYLRSHIERLDAAQRAYMGCRVMEEVNRVLELFELEDTNATDVIVVAP